MSIIHYIKYKTEDTFKYVRNGAQKAGSITAAILSITASLLAGAIIKPVEKMAIGDLRSLAVQ